MAVTTTEIDRCWRDLVAAKERGDRHAVRVLENRMWDLQQRTRFAHLDDEQLAARIAALDGNRLSEGMLAHSPGGNDGLDAGIADLMLLNQAIRAQQHVGVEELRSALLDEQARRAAAPSVA